MNPSSEQPTILRLIAVPALITLGVTLARLAGEFAGLPAWLANRDAGGPGALLGIAWLAPLFGIYFAVRLNGTTPRPYRRLALTLIGYGYAARVPVFVITILAVLGNWGTLYDNFGRDPAQQQMSLWTKLGFAAIFQLGGWVFVWTLGSGMITGVVILLALRRRRAMLQST